LPRLKQAGWEIDRAGTGLFDVCRRSSSDRYRFSETRP
jgi:hypothetical protein